MTDHVADVARLEAQVELERTKTIHAPPPDMEHDTGRVPKQTAEDVRVYLAVVAMQEQLGAIARYLEGRMDGVAVDVAQSQAFEMRASRALTLLDEKLDKVLGAIENLADGKMQLHQRIVSLEEWRRKRDIDEAQADLIRHQEAL